uniref:Uncharacterized protein n=1 Tax=Oryza sativa subsp. japonica TaxID=39947 RepID=Q6Z6Q5_ORYSJ|nr:hypothetical protein [Oryza sativa Japonica Group]
MEADRQQNGRSINRTLSGIRLADKWAGKTKLTRPKWPKVHKSAKRRSPRGRQSNMGWIGQSHGSTEPIFAPLDAGLRLDGVD